MKKFSQAGNSCHLFYWNPLRGYDLWLHVRGQGYVMHCNDHAVLHFSIEPAQSRQCGVKRYIIEFQAHSVFNGRRPHYKLR